MKPRDEKRYTRPVGERFEYEGETVEVVGMIEIKRDVHVGIVRVLAIALTTR